MRHVVFAGCSFTSGAGWDLTDPLASATNPALWVNLCHTQIKFLNQHNLINIGASGASNTEIFNNVIEAIGDHGEDIDTIFVQWTSYPRYSFNIGFELWSTSEIIGGLRFSKHDVKLSNGETWSRSYIDDLIKRLQVLHHPHWDILKIVKYTNKIKKIAKKFKIKNIFFINGLCHWDRNYFVKLENVSPESYTPYTKKEILNIDNRSDEDIFNLYNIAHTQYNEAGGIDPLDWINLYDSMNNNKIDTNLDQLHPGIKSNQFYFQQVSNFLKSR